MNLIKKTKPLLIVSAIALSGCTDSVVNTGNNFALKADFANSKATQTSTNVIVKPNFAYNGEIESVDVTAFGVTANFTQEDIREARNPFEIVKEVDGETIRLISAFTPWQEVFGINDQFNLSRNDEIDAKGRRRSLNLESHTAGFVVKHQSSEDEIRSADVVFEEEVPDPTHIAVFVVGDETEAENVGNFVEPYSNVGNLAEPGITPDAVAHYRGRATAVTMQRDNPEDLYTLSGRLDLTANFTQSTISGEISNLTGHYGGPHGTGGADNVQELGRGPRGDQFEETIIVNETDIVGNGFSTDLSVETNNYIAAGAVECASNCGGGQEIEGFFNSSQLEGNFYGEEGQEVGGTFTYDAAEEFTRVNQGAPCVTAPGSCEILSAETLETEPEAAPGSVAVGVFSGVAEDSSSIR